MCKFFATLSEWKLQEFFLNISELDNSPHCTHISIQKFNILVKVQYPLFTAFHEYHWIVLPLILFTMAHYKMKLVGFQGALG